MAEKVTGKRALALLKLIDAAEASNEIGVSTILAIRGRWCIYWYYQLAGKSELVISKGLTFYEALEQFDEKLKELEITNFTF